MSRERQKPYRVCYAFDTETTNINDGVKKTAFPILYQLGKLDETPIKKITAENVEAHVNVDLYRHAFELYQALDFILDSQLPYIPVIMCHNLSFDMYSLASWLDHKEVKVLAKSSRKPISFTILDDAGKPSLVIWDTLVFAQKPLELMGEECGYEKAVGKWDYSLIRTPDTPLTESELDYATKDVYALFAWMGYFLRMNPDVKSADLGLRIVTKTGIVRNRRYSLFGNVKGKGMKRTIGKHWMALNDVEAPKTDDELFTMHACTRGGYTFCASRHASIPYTGEDGRMVYGYDATSMHPAQMVSHMYPVRFHETSCKALDLAFSTVTQKDIPHLLKTWEKPFSVAFNACFKFTNIRPKIGSVFAANGIYPLASARFGKPPEISQEDENENARLFEHGVYERGYCDYADNAVFEFGKLVSADMACVYITELTAWEISRAYDFDSVEAVSGYMTSRFTRPPDMAVISVMQFYKAKNTFKNARSEWYRDGRITCGDELRNCAISESMVSAMENGSAYDSDVEFTYLGLKADLNALFGIEACNEYRRDTVLSSDGIRYTGDDGIHNAPKHPKAWYQFGQRIVGWSRIAQTIVMELSAPYAEIVNGDTDSIKLLTYENELAKINRELVRLARAIDKGKYRVCERVRCAYPDLYDPLDGIGHYILEFAAEDFCASWNKAYLLREYDVRDDRMHCHFTLAGIPTKRRKVYLNGNELDFPGLDGFADYYCNEHGFKAACDMFLGYNVTYSASTMFLNMRTFPEWGGEFVGRVTDYLGNDSFVCEPLALNLHPMTKTINDTMNRENRQNMEIAICNRPSVNTSPVLVYVQDGKLKIMRMGDVFE